jgi:hypothetical protein
MFCHRLLRSITDTRTVTDGTDTSTMTGWPQQPWSGGGRPGQAQPYHPEKRTI